VVDERRFAPQRSVETADPSRREVTTGELEGLLQRKSRDLTPNSRKRRPICVCWRGRKRGVQTPVLVLTAKDTVEDRVLGLDCGADDYLVNPSALPSCWRGSGRFFGAGGWIRS
jgi:hypothetical protein